MAITGRGHYAHLIRSLRPPTDLEVLWYKYDEDEFYYYDFGSHAWTPYSKKYFDRIVQLEERVNNLVLGNGETYTNLTPMPEKVGGYPQGTTFDNVAEKDFKDGLLYPYQSPQFSYFRLANFTSSRYEVGTVINGLQPFVWGMTNADNVENDTIEISGQAISTTSNLPNTGSFDVVVDNLTKVSKGTHSWLILATNTKGQTFSKSATVRWDFRQFWGVSNLETLTENDIKNLQSNRLTLNTVLNHTYEFGATGYKFFAFADEYAAPSKFLDIDTGFGVQMFNGFANSENGFSYDLVNVTSNGVTKAYRVYRTAFVLDLAVNVEVT